MAAVPLTLETTPQTNATAEPNLIIPPLPQLKTDANHYAERPSNLTLVEPQHSHNLTSSVLTPVSTLTLGGNISPALSTTGSLSPSFLPEMPQWKRDLIQRRKQNVQRTLSASSQSPSQSPSPSPSAAAITLSTTSSGGALYGGLKKSTSLSSSVRSLAGSNTNIDQLAAADGLLQQPQHSLTKDYTTLKVVNKQQQQYAAKTTPNTTATNTTKPATINYIKSSSSSSSLLTSSLCSSSSPLKEKAERLFGGQYTATTKEEIFIQTQQQQQKQIFRKENHTEEMAENNIKTKYQQQQQRGEQEFVQTAAEEETDEKTYEMLKKNKEIQEEEQVNEEQIHETATITIKTSDITNKQQQQQQQTITRLTGSTCTTTNTSSSTLTSTSTSSSSLLLTKRATAINTEYERDNLASHFSSGISTGGGGGSINSHNSITGANVNFVNQLVTKCESERLVCAANTTTTVHNTNIQNNTTGYSNNYLNNSGSGSVTIGGNTGVNNSSNSLSSSGGLNSVSVGNVVKISQKLQENQFIKNEQQQLQQQQQQKKFLRYQKFNNNSSTTTAATAGGSGVGLLDLKSPTRTFLTTSSSATSLSSPTTSSSSAAALAFNSSNCAIKKKMVAVQEMKKSTQNSATHLHPINTTCNNSQQQQQQQQLNRALATNRGGGGMVGVDVGVNNTATDLDTSEDLSYGPGIVSKLRCRYLSLALRESMEQQRLNKDHLRRSTSLNNLLDNTTEDDDDEEEEDEDLIEGEVVAENTEHNSEIKNLSAHHHHLQMSKKTSGILKSPLNNGQEKRFSPSSANNSQGSNGVGVTFTETTFTKRSRHLKRGNDSLKRARSVEALLSEKSPWHVRANSSTTCTVSIEDKIINARERLHQGTDHMPPKRLTSIIDDTERPPPDLVKQTLKKFEATANRRPRLNSRSNSKGDVASKVETFKNIEKKQKPVVNYPKPISPTKKLQKPLKFSTPQTKDLLQSPLGRKVLATANAITNNQSGANENVTTTPLKTGSGGNTLSEHTPDIIPRQTQTQQTKFTSNERDFKHNKELFTSKEKTGVVMVDILKRGDQQHIKEKLEVVDSPVTALTKELNKLKISSKNDNFSSTVSSSNVSSSSLNDSRESESAKDGGGSGGGSGGVDGSSSVDYNIGDACQRYNKYSFDETTNQQQQLQEEFKNENDKIINNKTKQINSETSSTTSSIAANAAIVAANTTIEMKNEATTVKNYETLFVKTATASPPASSSDLSDGGGNEYDVEDVEYGNTETNATTTTKRITRTALDNIAKAGFTQQFKFNNSQQQQNSSTSSPLNAGKQIGVIRPLLNTQTTTTKTSLDNNMETLKHSHTSNTTSSPLTSREIEKNRINDMKKSSLSSTMSSLSTSTSTSSSSSSSTSLDNVITSSSSVSASATNATSGVASSTGFSDVDTVISATNSPLWAMRKRRQTPPAAPAENTTMVFNFSNRKEVPDYIDNDGVIFRRKRELPKPNESGFVLLGDLSVETSTDMDYDDFSMCPPSPCDVEFINANIVIDGKSSIRQKSKETTHYRVQFNDTLNSTFEYPSAASLCMDESFSAYSENYTQPHDSNSLMPNDLSQAFQSLCLENQQQQQQQHHHVADEIIQLPTLNASSPATANNSSPLGGGTNVTPTKNILGNLPLDYPDSEKGIQLTNNLTLDTQEEDATPLTANRHNDNNDQNVTEKKEKKSRKDLKLPLGQPPLQQPMKPMNLQKPPLPVKRLEMISPLAAPKFLNSKNLKVNSKSYDEPMNQVKQEIPQKVYPPLAAACKENEEIVSKPKPRKTPRVLDKPQYACFLHTANQDIKYPIQRSRSNEFQKTFPSYLTSTTHVSRSNSLRNLDNFPLKRAPRNTITTTTTITSSSTTTTNGAAHALYFSAEVNSKNQFSSTPTNKAKMASNAYEKSPNANMPAVTSDHNFTNEQNFSHINAVVNYRSQSFLNLPSHNPEMTGKSKEFEFKSQSLGDLAYQTKIIESPYKTSDARVKSLDNFKTLSTYTEEKYLENLNSKAKSLENFNSSSNHLNSPMPTLQSFHNNHESNLVALSYNSSKICDQFEASLKDTENQAVHNLAAFDELNETVVKANSALNSEISFKILENTINNTANDLEVLDNLKVNVEEANSENSLGIIENSINDSSSDLVALSQNLLKITESLNPSENVNLKAKSLENSIDLLKINETKTLATPENTNNNKCEVNLLAVPNNSLQVAESNCGTTAETAEKANTTNLAALVQVKESEMKVKSLENLSFPLHLENSVKNITKCKENSETDLAGLSQNLLKTTNFQILSEGNAQENQNIKIEIIETSSCQKLLQEIENETVATLLNSSNSNEGSISLVSDDLLQKSESKALENLAKTYNNEVNLNLAVLENLQETVKNEDLKQENYLEETQEKNENLTKESEKGLAQREDALKLFRESEDILSVTVNTDCKPKILPKREYKSPQTLSLTINTDYLTGYSANIKHKPRNQNKNTFTTEHSLSLSLNRGIEIKKQSKSEENLASPLKLLDKTESNAKSLSCENFSDVIEYNLHKNFIENSVQAKEEEEKALPEILKEIPEESVPNKTINLGHLNKSLQMSLDSLDDYEDALASYPLDDNDSVSKKAGNSEVIEASEILEDIAVGIDSESIFDFKNLLTFKRSRTEYCLKDLNKSVNFSVDDDESEETFNSACNTLESKASLKTYKPQSNDTKIEENFDIPISSNEIVKPQLPINKPNKTLRRRTTEKILHFTHHASQNVSSSYATFRKSKNFYKNASKSFKNSLKFYETYNEKSSNQLTLVTRQQTPLSLGKKAEPNRKTFSKSCKLNRGKLYENPDSPTENSYSFEYFDAESDRNGNLITTVAINLDDQEVNHIPEENKDSILNVPPVTLELNNFKPPGLTNEFYFNNSPRPFKRVYEAPSLICNEQTSAVLSCTMEKDQSPNALEYKTPISFINSSLRLKPFKASTELYISKENSLGQDTKSIHLEPPGMNTAFKTPASVTTTGRSRSFSVADSINFYNNSQAPMRNSFSSRSSSALGASNTLKIEENPNKFATNNLAVSQSGNSDNFSTQSLNSFVNNSPLGSRKEASFKKEIPMAMETPFSITNYGNSGNSDNFLGNQYVVQNNDVSQPSPQTLEGSLNNSYQISENINNSTPKIYTNTMYLALKTKTPTPSTPTTLMVKDLINQNTTPTTSTTCATSTTLTTNFPTKVVVLKQQQTIAKNVSYATCSSSSSSTFSPMFSNKKQFIAATTTTTNATSTTGKYYHHYLKATPPLPAPLVPPLKKKFTTKPSTKVLMRRKDCMTTTSTTATTTITYSSTTTTTSTTSCINTCLKSTPTSYNSAGNKIIAPAPPLRRRIPGNTLYYV